MAEEVIEEPSVPLTLMQLSQCSDDKSWTREKIINHLNGTWQWQYELIFSSRLDTAFDTHAGLKVTFNKSNRLILSEDGLLDTIYYDVRHSFGAFELFVLGDTLPHVDGSLLVCEEEMCVIWGGGQSLGIASWYFKE